MSAHIIDTCDAVVELIDSITNATTAPLIFVDLEGINLSRHGSISIMQLLIPPIPVVHLIDVLTLQANAFDTPGTKGQTLKILLESDRYGKVFFDVRSDSDALFSHFGLHLRGVIDLQLVEYASRPRPGKYIKGLAKCISEDGHMSMIQAREWARVKEVGRNLFAPEKGGSYEVFNKRPLVAALRDYCVQDVMVLPKLLSVYAEHLQTHMAAQIYEEGQRRVALSQSPGFNGIGPHMAVAPSFTWTRPRATKKLDFPISILCSKQLGGYCTVQDATHILKKEETMVKEPRLPNASGETAKPESEDSALDLSRGLKVLRLDD